MKKYIHTLFIYLAFCVLLLPRVHAEGFPEDYVKHDLAEANRGVVVDITHLGEGKILTVLYVGRPVFIYRRTASDLARLKDGSESLHDPRNEAFLKSVQHEFGSTSDTVWARLLMTAEQTAKHVPFRSQNEAIFVAGGWSPVSGCELTLVQTADRASPNVVFRDPCTGITFDAAGRAFSRQQQATGPKPVTIFNMVVPPYRIEGNNVVLGSIPGQPLPELLFTKSELCGDGTPTQNLMCAARYNDISSVRKAIREGADVNYYKFGKGGPIDSAIIGSSIEVIELLLQHGARFTFNSENLAHFLHREDVLALIRLGRP